MQGNKKVIEQLNLLLASELTAINQYMVHSEMCSNFGYKELSDYIKGRAKEEMGHAEMLIERIIFLEGTPTVSKLNAIYIGKEVPDMHDNDHDAETVAINGYNAAIAVAVEAKDNGTRSLLEKILRDEEEHINVIEEHIAMIEQMKLENYLVEQV